MQSPTMKKGNYMPQESALSSRNKSNPHNQNNMSGLDRNLFGTIGNSRINALGSTKSILANHANKINMGMRNELNSIQGNQVTN